MEEYLKLDKNCFLRFTFEYARKIASNLGTIYHNQIFETDLSGCFGFLLWKRKKQIQNISKPCPENFRNTKITKNGKPRLVYRGLKDSNLRSNRILSEHETGIYFITNPMIAASYSELGQNSKVLECYLNVQNPYIGRRFLYKDSQGYPVSKSIFSF